MGELEDVGLFLVQRDFQLRAYLPDALKDFLQPFLAIMYDVAVVHVPPVAPDAAHVFDVVVEAVRGGQRKGLAYLAAEAQPLFPEHTHKVLRDGDDALIRELLPEDVFAYPVRYVVEEFAEVEQEDVALRPVLAVVLPKMLTQSPDGEVVALVLQRCRVVINECPAQHRHEGVVTEASLHNALPDGYGFDVPQLPALVDVELVKAAGPPFPLLQALVGLLDHKRGLRDVLLDAGLPCHVPPAPLVGTIEVFV